MALTKINIGGREVSVEEDVGKRLALANASFKAATGQELKINEAYRSTERQAELYAKSQAGEIGRAAPPGKSFHETGKAVDVANWQEAQPYLNKFGLANDLKDDRNHFSIGETNKVPTNFADIVEKGRKKGLTDTEMLNAFAAKKADFAQNLQSSRSKFGSGGKINNDRDLINALSVKFSAKMPTTPSVPAQEQQATPFGLHLQEHQ